MATEKRLIDATPLIDECMECSAIEWNRNVYATWAEAEEDFMQRLLDAPTVDAVEVVHGRWEPRTDVPGFLRCSACHDCNIYDDWPDGKKWNYCPNCGAKMDEEEQACPT